MIIDIHSHVFIDPKIKYKSENTTFMSASQQIEVMDRDGIDLAVILPLTNPEASPECQGLWEVIEICKLYPGRFIPFCNVDPRLMGSLLHVDVNHFEFILNQYKDAGCKGLGELTAKMYWDDSRLLNLLEACQRVGFPVTFHTSLPESSDYGLMDEIGFPRFEQVLKKFPGLTFLGHSQSFWAEISGELIREDKNGYPAGTVKPGGAVPRLMRQYPNLNADISANSGLNALRRDPEFAYSFIEEFQARIHFGLDYCSPTNDRQHISWLIQARDQGGISQQAFDKIMYINTSRVLKLQI
jgi:uncharacterized protein